MNEFYIYERFKVNNVEAVRIVPLRAGRIEMFKKPWGVTIDNAVYCGHVELRTLLGHVVDSHSGKYADYNTRQDFTLLLPEYELYGIYSHGSNDQFIYVQYIHIETGVPLLLRYESVDESPISLHEFRDVRWGEVDRVSYFRHLNDFDPPYVVDVIVPLMRGCYVETERHEATVYIVTDSKSLVDVENGVEDLKLNYQHPEYGATLQLNEGVIKYKNLTPAGKVIDGVGWDLNNDDNRTTHIEYMARLIHGVKSITNSK